MTTFDPRSKKFLLFTVLYWVAVFLALYLWSRNWAIVQPASEKQEHLFGLWGFCVFGVLAYLAYSDLKLKPVLQPKEKIRIGIPIAVSLIFLALVVEMSQKSWDYIQYEEAFQTMAIGGNPYQNLYYLYPPSFAKVMVSVYQLGLKLFPIFGIELKKALLWFFVFYIHQCALFFSLLLAYYLCLKLSQKLGIGLLESVLFVSSLFLLNVPVLRTVSYNQVNFSILFLILAAMLVLSRFPFLSGFAIAIGGLIKLYPLGLLFPLLWMKKWRALLGSLVGVVGIILLETSFFQNLLHWKQFVRFYMSVPMQRERALFRSTSPLGFVQNTLGFLNLPSAVITTAGLIVLLLILAWFVFRLWQRERIYFRWIEQPVERFITPEKFREVGHLVDFPVLSLLVTPLAWEHHFVMAIPLAIWVFAFYKSEIPWWGWIGMFLVFLLPVFNVFPFSYLRMLGLIVLLVVSSPQKLSKTLGEV